MPTPILFGLLSLLPAALPGRAAQEASQREAIPAPARLHECLHPALWPALQRVHALEAAYIELSILTPEGTLVPTPPRQDSPAGKLLMEGRPGLFPGLAAFDFVRPGDPPPSVPIELLLECGLYNAGYEAARAAWAAAPDLTPSDLLATVEERFLMAEPVLGTDLARDLHRRSLQQQRLGALTHGSIGYVLFGFLHLSEFWRDRQTARGEFISGLLERGIAGPLPAWTVRRALQAPLQQNSPTAARGIAMGWDSRRGPVGFLPAHEARLDALLRELEAERDRFLQPVAPGPLPPSGGAAAEEKSKPEGVPAAPGPQAGAVEAGSKTGSNAPPQGPGEAGRDRIAAGGGPASGGWDATGSGRWKALEARLAWTSELLLWVQRELHPGQLQQQFRRAASLTKRMEYWDDLVDSIPFVELREELLRELQAMLADEDGWPGMDRVRELKALSALGALTPEQASELRGLEQQIDVQQLRLMSHMTRCLVESSGPDHYDLLADTLLGDIPKLLAGSDLGDPLSFDSNLQVTWLLLASMGGPGPGRLLEGQLDGTRPKLTPMLADTMLRTLPDSSIPDRERILNRYLREGSLGEQLEVLVKSSWLGDDAYRQQLQGYLQRAKDPATPAEDRTRIRDGLLESLRRRGGAVAKSLLLESIQSGLWLGADGASSWSQADPQEVAEALSLLSPGERVQLVQQGWLPPQLAF